MKIRHLIRQICLFLSSFLILPSCYSSDPDIKMAYAIMNKHAEYMKRKYNAHVIGMGSGFPDKMTELGLTFDIPGPMNVDEARKVILLSSQHLLDMINNNEELRPYMANYPFTYKNLNYSFFVCDANGETIEQDESQAPFENLSYFCFSLTGIWYKVQDSETGYLKDVYSESYETATSIIKK